MQGRLAMLLRAVFLLLILLPLLGFSIRLFRVAVVNWTTTNNELMKSLNPELPLHVNRLTSAMFISCRDHQPATLHLIPAEDVEDCRATDGNIAAHCPDLINHLNVLHLDPYPAGDYYLTSFSDRNRRGSDALKGGFCSEGYRVGPIHLYDGADDFHVAGHDTSMSKNEKETEKARQELGVVNYTYERSPLLLLLLSFVAARLL